MLNLGASQVVDIVLDRRMRIRRTGNPFGAVTRCRLLKHAVHLFKRQALCLANQEVRKHDTKRAGCAPDEEHLSPQIAFLLVNHVWRDVANDKVPKPIGCGGERNALGADREWEDLADDDPSGRSPG